MFLKLPLRLSRAASESVISGSGEICSLRSITKIGGSGSGGAFRPSDMRAAYAGGTSLTGAGQSVAMVEFDGYNMADVVSDMGGTDPNHCRSHRSEARESTSRATGRQMLYQ